MIQLTKAEAKIMKIIWAAGCDLDVREVMGRSAALFHTDWKPQTVSTLMARLVKKDILSMYRQGRTFLYHPLVPLEEFLPSMLQDMVDFWYDGDAEAAIRGIQQLK